jgi:hypothetical protein
MKEWQFNVLFFVGVGGAVLLLIGPEFGLTLSDNPTALTGVGAILTYVLTYKRILNRSPDDDKDKKGPSEPPKEVKEDGSG